MKLLSSILLSAFILVLALGVWTLSQTDSQTAEAQAQSCSGELPCPTGYCCIDGYCVEETTGE